MIYQSIPFPGKTLSQAQHFTLCLFFLCAKPVYAAQTGLIISNAALSPEGQQRALARGVQRFLRLNSWNHITTH